MTGEVLAGHDTARTQALDRTGRDHQARLALASRALNHDDPETWLAEMLDILGLATNPDRKVSRMPMIEPGDGNYATRNASVNRRRSIGPKSLADHGTYSRYQSPCHCDPCKLAGIKYRLDLSARKRGVR